MLPADQDDVPGRARRVLQHVRRGHARRVAGEPQGLRQRVRASAASASTETIEDAPRFLRHLEPVARTLADEDTQLARFFRELGDAARIVAPVADRYAHSFTVGARHLRGVVARPRGAASRRSRSRRRRWTTGISSFRVQRPFLREFRDFSASLERAAPTLPRTLPRITPALDRGHAGRAPLGRDERGARQDARERSTALMSDPRTGDRAARRHAPDRDPQPAAALRRAVRHGLQLLQLLASRTSASTSPSPTRPAPRSARCSTRPRARSTRATRASARSAPAGRSTASRRLRRQADDLHSNVYSAAVDARRARPTASPASAATSRSSRPTTTTRT